MQPSNYPSLCKVPKHPRIFLPLFFRVLNVFLWITLELPLTNRTTEIIFLSFVGYYDMGPVYVYSFPADWIDMFFHYDFPNYLLRLQNNGCSPMAKDFTESSVH